jgi:hypothetical protein
MVWLLERNNDVLTCEIRQTPDSTAFEFELASRRGPAETLRFNSPTELINGFLRRQTALQAQGWRPRPLSLDADSCW